jgi:hypothetical protein
MSRQQVPNAALARLKGGSGQWLASVGGHALLTRRWRPSQLRELDQHQSTSLRELVWPEEYRQRAPRPVEVA